MLAARSRDSHAQSFYVDTMEEDGRRVERLFRDAAALGIAIQARCAYVRQLRPSRRSLRSRCVLPQRRSISLDEMRRYILSGQYLVVALVDKRKARQPALPSCAARR